LHELKSYGEAAQEEETHEVDLDMAIEESGAASGVPFAILEVIWPW
jgi:hypothetical protein